jgi:DNA-binding NtrC family response regulator
MSDTTRTLPPAEPGGPSNPGAPGPAVAELHVVFPPELRATIRLAAEPLTLGRQPDDPAAPALLHQGVSRRHFAIEWDPARRLHTGVDLGSRNGSAVDGVPAGVKVPLGDGSVIRVGPVLLVYEVVPPAAPPDPPQVSRDAVPGDAVASRWLRAEVARAAGGSSPVLRVGEAGTGKELLAREIHRLSGRAGPFVAVDCAAANRELVAGGLFEDVEGASPEAPDARPGAFRSAEGGTLALGEIGELPLDLQARLLRVLEERPAPRLGAARAGPPDARIVATSGRDLSGLVEGGGFLRDLHARLSSCEIRVPPLGRRRADLFVWIERLYRRWSAERGLPADRRPDLDPPLAEALLLREWPDNLRGLDRLVHGFGDAIRAGRPITLTEVPVWASGDPAPAAANAAGEGREVPDAAAPAPAAPRSPAPSREALEAVLRQHNGSVRATARHFGRDRRQIYRWLEAYGIKVK